MSKIQERLARLAHLSPHKRELVLKQLRQKGMLPPVDNNHQQLPMQPVPRQEDFPLSFAQQRLWFLDQLKPGLITYNIPLAMQINGRLNLKVLKKALSEILRRHEALRTNFPAVLGQPVQVIRPAQPLPLPLIDLQALPEARRKPEARRLAMVEGQQPFNLAQDLLLRATLLQLGQAQYVIFLTMHHIVSDGWSTNILLQELTHLYQAYITGKPSSLPSLPIQYADFAYWQREWLQGEKLAAQLTYWQKQLAGTLGVLALPTDRLRPTVQTSRGAVHAFRLSASLSAALKDLSQQEGTTLFTTLLAAFKVLLHRYTGQDDIVVGTPVSGRNRVEIERLIGFFVNTLPLRTILSGNATFRELLAQVHEVTLAAQAHQDLPFERLVDALKLARDLSYTPLFQVTFSLQGASPQKTVLPELTLNTFASEHQTTKFDLSLALFEEGERLEGALEYNRDLFNASTISKMGGHLETLLTGLMADPDQTLSTLSLLPPPERQQLLVSWNNTHTTQLKRAYIHQLFEIQAEKTPDAVAVAHQDTHLTYRELNRRANQLAHHLRARALQPGTPVGVYLNRDLNAAVTILAILKADCVYVPIDIAFPAERVAFILQDTQIPLCLTYTNLARQLPACQASLLHLDTEWEMISGQSPTNPVNRILPEHTAYIIYTSGSTGQPKGVCISHHVAANHFASMRRDFEFTQQDRTLWFFPLSSDGSLEQLFAPLAAGATIIIKGDALWATSEFFTQVAQKKITAFGLAPSYWYQLLQDYLTRPTGSLSQVRMICVGSDVLTPEAINLWQQTPLRRARLINAYGPTEATVTATLFDVSLPQTTVGKQIPIGRPCGFRTAYILDKYNQLAPIGVSGELYLGGPLLSTGYLNKPGHTAERFVPNPFSLTPGRKLYKTGDMARYLPDGNIEFLGRTDHQVKIRGFRVELGEIEAALSQHPAIQESVLMIRTDRPDHKRLVAYLVFNDKTEAPAIGELRLYLEQKLPHYMIPAAFVILDELPLTPIGKVDRQVLPMPPMARVELAADFTAPRSTVEKTLAQIWADVLGVEAIGIHDNFFELGGDSIISIQIVARANQAGLQLSPKHLFLHQTISELAPLATAVPQTSTQQEQELVTGTAPLTPIQHWFFQQSFPQPHHYNQAILLEVPPIQHPALLAHSVSHLRRHHDVLRSYFTQTSTGWHQVYPSPQDETLPFVTFDLTLLPASRQQTTIEKITAVLQTSLGLNNGPLMRVAFFHLSPQQPGRLLIVIHHLIIDVVSWRILLPDLHTIYEQLNRGEQPALPPKTATFKQWSTLLHNYGHSSAVQQEAAYWLADTRQNVAPLPVDKTGGDNRIASTQTTTISLNPPETESLLKEVPKAYQTQVNDALLTALVYTIGQWTGEYRVLVDLEGHGREELFDDIDLSRTIGWFTTMYPVLLTLKAETPIGEGLKQVKEQLRTIPHKGIGYGVLHYLHDDHALQEKLQAMPQADISFNYLGQLDRGQTQSGQFRAAAESSGPLQSQLGPRPHLLAISGVAVNEQLSLNIEYSYQQYHPATIEQLAQTYITNLRSLIQHCLSEEAGGYTPSDFPLAQVSQQQLDKFLGKTKREKQA